MDKKLTVSIIGCGQRGIEIYARLMKREFSDKFTFVSLCDINKEALEQSGRRFDVKNENLFVEANEFFKEKRSDLLILSTQDKDHAWMLIRALELGYDVLVEKPLTKNREECEAMLEAQRKYGGKVIVCHVLRYAPAFVKVAELLDSGSIGKLVCIESLEQVWYAHQAHSFVRGNWHSSEETSPMIIAKCCHDLDLLQYYAGARCESISSMGDLVFFRPENASEGATKRCLDCPHQDTCPYSAKLIYLNRARQQNFDWPTTGITYIRPLSTEVVEDCLKNGDYGKCVFYCDNDVVDHQQTIMTFENGVKATLTMTAFTLTGGRTMTFHGTLGEIRLNEEEDYVSLRQFGKEVQKWSIKELQSMGGGGHGGGDIGLIRTLYDAITVSASPRTSLEASIESHLMGIAAEESRLEGGKLKLVHG